MIFEPIFEFGSKLVLIHREIQLRVIKPVSKIYELIHEFILGYEIRR